MSGLYTVPFSGAALAVSVDLAEVVAHANKGLIILGWVIYQTTELGDAAEEQLAVTLKSGQTTAGSGGAASTPANNDPSGGGAAGFTAAAMNTTKASLGTIVTHIKRGWNVRQEMDIILPDIEQIVLGGGRRATLEISAPADAMDVAGYLKVQEIG